MQLKHNIIKRTARTLFKNVTTTTCRHHDAKRTLDTTDDMTYVLCFWNVVFVIYFEKRPGSMKLIEAYFWLLSICMCAWRYNPTFVWFSAKQIDVKRRKREILLSFHCYDKIKLVDNPNLYSLKRQFIKLWNGIKCFLLCKFMVLRKQYC